MTPTLVVGRPTDRLRSWAGRTGGHSAAIGASLGSLPSENRLVGANNPRRECLGVEVALTLAEIGSLLAEVHGSRVDDLVPLSGDFWSSAYMYA